MVAQNRIVAVLACLLLCLSGQVVSARQKPSAEDESRVARLDELAKALEKVVIHKTRTSENRLVEGRRFSKKSELHLRFLVCVSGLADNRQDGILVFPIQVSGFTSEIGAKPVKPQAGSDFQQVRVNFKGLIGTSKPKARVEMPELTHGSTFPATQLARDEIHAKIRQYLPECEIEGMQKFFEKAMEVKNESGEALRVFCFHNTWAKNAEGKYSWGWKPGEPNSTRPIEIRVASKSTAAVTIPGDEGATSPVTGNRVLIWAESESGERWLQHRNDSLWVVDENPQFDRERVYHAEKIQTYSHVIKPQPGPHTYTERVLELKNDSTEQLSVRLRYWTKEDGRSLWREKLVDMPAGSRVRPLGDGGYIIRASRLYLSAESENRRYSKHIREPIWLVDEVSGRRAYLADKIGTYLYTFERVGKEGPGSATVKADRVDIMDGPKVVATATRNQSYEILEQRDAWVRVRFAQQGVIKAGWIPREQIEMKNPTPDFPPVSVSETFQVTAGSTDVKLGTVALARLTRGNQYQVLEKNGSWLRVEVTVNGSVVQGWVNSADGQITTNQVTTN